MTPTRFRFVRRFLPSVALAAFVLTGCRDRVPSVPVGPDADADGHTAPSPETAAANAAVLRDLPFGDRQDFEDARRGRIGGEEEVRITAADGSVVWSSAAYGFIEGEAPPSVNPSLWRQAQLNGIHGLFEVTNGVWQVRGYDISNMTWIEGASGWIVVDPLTAAETARAAFDLVGRHLPRRPVSAVIFTHSHIDHFGGVAGILSAGEARERGVRIVAPEGFMEEATSENVLAGIAMGRRATLMYGMNLARGPRGHVDTGLGVEPARGRFGILPPTDLVDSTPQEMELDGVRFVFQHAPDTEAPAELTFYLPERKAFCGAEVVSHVQHNLYTLRGAKVRDALAWSAKIDEAIGLFGDVEVLFASHHWPMWGNERIVTFLEGQRDLYKYIHDQTLRLANAGATPREIAEELELPESLRRSFANRGYYGTVRHNAKAVYQNYFGWYDGNPANLDPLPPAEEARRMVEYMGGAAEVVRKAEASLAAGDVRWAATVMNHVVFAEPENGEARALLARAYDQLGYRAESGPWRDVYLSAARELRHGTPPPGAVNLAKAVDLLRHMPLGRFFDSMAVRLNGPKAEGKTLVANFVFTDAGESFVVTIRNSVLHHRAAPPDADAAFTVKLTRELFLRIATREAGLRELVFSDDLDVDGSRLELLGFFRLLDDPDGGFAIVTP